MSRSDIGGGNSPPSLMLSEARRAVSKHAPPLRPRGARLAQREAVEEVSGF